MRWQIQCKQVIYVRNDFRYSTNFSTVFQHHDCRGNPVIEHMVPKRMQQNCPIITTPRAKRTLMSKIQFLLLYEENTFRNGTCNHIPLSDKSGLTELVRSKRRAAKLNCHLPSSFPSIKYKRLPPPKCFFKLIEIFLV